MTRMEAENRAAQLNQGAAKGSSYVAELRTGNWCVIGYAAKRTWVADK